MLKITLWERFFNVCLYKTQEDINNSVFFKGSTGSVGVGTCGQSDEPKIPDGGHLEASRAACRSCVCKGSFMGS